MNKSILIKIIAAIVCVCFLWQEIAYAAPASLRRRAGGSDFLRTPQVLEQKGGSERDGSGGAGSAAGDSPDAVPQTVAGQGAGTVARRDRVHNGLGRALKWAGSNKALIFFITAGVVFGLDQVAKWLVVSNTAADFVKEALKSTSFFKALSLPAGSDYSAKGPLLAHLFGERGVIQPVLHVVSSLEPIIKSAILITLAWLYRDFFTSNRLRAIVFGLLFGGVLGNLADLIARGGAWDWISYSIQISTGSFIPLLSVNIADLAQFISICLMIIMQRAVMPSSHLISINRIPYLARFITLSFLLHIAVFTSGFAGTRSQLASIIQLPKTLVNMRYSRAELGAYFAEKSKAKTAAGSQAGIIIGTFGPYKLWVGRDPYSLSEQAYPYLPRGIFNSSSGRESPALSVRGPYDELPPFDLPIIRSETIEGGAPFRKYRTRWEENKDYSEIGGKTAWMN